MLQEMPVMSSGGGGGTSIEFLKEFNPAPSTYALGVPAGNYKMIYFGVLYGISTVTNLPDFSISNGTISSPTINYMNNGEVALIYDITVSASSNLVFTSAGDFRGTTGAGHFEVIAQMV